jgi:uncharacterized protein DUF6962
MMQITEPVTMLTNIALAAASLTFAYLLARSIGPANRVSAWLWCAAFITSAIAAVFGATYHGFALYFDPATLRSFWNIIMSATGATAGFMIAGCHAAYIKKEDGVMEYLVAGIAVTLLGVIVQATGFRHKADFNHNDAYHVIQMFGLYLFFKAASRLRDRAGVVT